MSVGKDFQLREEFTIRPHFNAGLYVWQTHAEEYFQNDALMYGLGCEFKWQRFENHPSLDSYHGYLDGDRPMVFRTTLKTRLKGRINYLFRFPRRPS
ncbi:MAG: hypothetical protein U5L96_10285 [Owenweeksia sp.]|nr:hypothetical protein [Owenweeksia sp.]